MLISRIVLKKVGLKLLINDLDADFTDPTDWGFHCPHAEIVRGHMITGIEHYGCGAGAFYVRPPIAGDERIPNQAIVIFGIPPGVPL